MSDVVYKVTQDHSLIKKTIELRSYIYHNDKNMTGLLSKGQRDVYDNDDNTHTIVITKDSKIIGSVRVTVRTPENGAKLPIEDMGLCLEDLFPNLSLNRINIVQYSKLLINPDHRDTSILLGLFVELKSLSMKLNVQYGILDTNVDYRCRLFCALCKKIKLKAQVLDNLYIPPNESTEYVEPRVVVVNFTSEDNVDTIFFPSTKYLRR